MTNSLPPASNQRILAIIPAYNEEQHIADVIKSAALHLPVLVVDDGSTDHTREVASQNGARVLRQIPNQGKGAALRTGFQHAIQEGFDAVLMLDADGQHDPAEIPKFLACYQSTRADLIIGAREYSQMPIVRRISNNLGKLMLRWALGQDVRDNQSGYRLISSRLCERMLESVESGFEFEVEMVTWCLRGGFQLEWVAIRTIYADEKSHIQPLKHLIHFIRITLKARRVMKS
jgi:glycosyltransferase involved in cell wall biosynthesis